MENITIISGTNRPGSSTLKLSKYYQKQFAEGGVNTNLLSLEELPDNLIASDLYGQRSEGFRTILELINHSQKFVFIIPEYNGSFPGVLKTFIDACDFPASFYNKKAALVGLSAGKYGNIRGIEHFTGVCNYIHLHVHPLRIHITNVKQELDENGNLHLPETIKFTNEQIEKIIAY